MDNTKQSAAARSIYAGIVAGGKGTRITQGDVPKQFLEIGGVPVLIRTINKFLEFREIRWVYVGINPDWYDYAAALLDRHGLTGSRSRVKLINGGQDRNGTVLNILYAIMEDQEVIEGDILLTHDAVRPFVSAEIIRRNITGAQDHLVCGTYIPSDDTIIRSFDGATVGENLDRSQLMRAQTPQSFEISTLVRCIRELGLVKVSQLTDTCGILTACGIPITMVEGEPGNFKITTDYDLKVAEALALLAQ